MTYEKYININREELVEKMSQIMSSKRLQHVLGVEQAAIYLAEINHYDAEKAGLAGLLHDYAKEASDEEFLTLIDKYQLDQELKQWNNNVWHGVVGVYKIQEELQLRDSDIIQAIANHTVGSSQMTTLDKIVYVADYIEHNRSFPLVDQARDIAEQSLDKAVAFETMHTVEYLAHKGQPIYPRTLDTYNAYINYIKD